MKISSLTISFVFFIFTFKSFANNPQSIEETLSKNIYQLSSIELNKLLHQYKKEPQYNQNLALFAEGRIAFLNQNYSQAISLYRTILANNPQLNAVRVELATALFIQKQDMSAKQQFEKARAEIDLPEDTKKFIDSYLYALEERQIWKINFSINYLRDSNVNNVANTENITLSNSADLTKSGRMLPQKAHGIQYFVGLAKDFNLINSHYFSFENQFSGKTFWDNHYYDDISNRLLFGYAYKTSNYTFRLTPFYSKRWYGNTSYRWNNGIRSDLSYWITPQWQVSTNLEWEKQHYFDENMLNGNNKQISNTLIWLPNPNQFLYVGSDFLSENTIVRQYSSNSTAIRMGWGQEWKRGISSQIHLSFLKRKFKDIAKLGNLDFFSFGKIRKDNIFSVNLILWKRDWHLWGITPKLQVIWKKQSSNIPQMYSYTLKNVNILFEKTF